MIHYNKLAFDFSPAPIVVLSNRHMVEMNHAFAQMFGYEREELLHHSIIKIFPSIEDYEKVGNDALQSLLQKNSLYYSDQRFMQHKSGEIFWTHTHGRTLTPEDPFQLMVWHFERKEQHPTAAEVKVTETGLLDDSVKSVRTVYNFKLVDGDWEKTATKTSYQCARGKNTKNFQTAKCS